MIDHDNKNSKNSKETPDFVVKTLAQYELPVAFAYETFSSTLENMCFRTGLVSDRPFTNCIERDRVQTALIKLFSQSDPNCINADRIFFGTDKGFLEGIGDINAVCNKEPLLALADTVLAEEREQEHGDIIPEGQREQAMFDEGTRLLTRYGDYAATRELYDNFIQRLEVIPNESDPPQGKADYVYKRCQKHFHETTEKRSDYEPPEEYNKSKQFDEQTESRQKIIDTLLNEPCSIDLALSQEYISQAAWAYLNDSARYVKLKKHIPKDIGTRTFEREVKKQIKITPQTKTSLNKLTLKDVSVNEMLIPENWVVGDDGIFHIEMLYGKLEPVLISSEPLFISSKLLNVDDSTEKLELTFRRNGKYKKLVAPRADILNRNTIIKYADNGFPVSSGTAATLTRYISEMEAVNNQVIPIQRSIRRAGWIDDEFFPYSMKNAIITQSDGNETERLLDALHKQGDEAVWMTTAAKVRTWPFARAMLAASFASPLLKKLQHRNIYIHIWCDSLGGKTAVLKFSISIWGNPLVLVSKYFSTIVGMERLAGTLKHLPLALDELQTLNQKRLSVNDVVYTLGNGVGKTRWRVGTGIQHVEEWHNCILSTGEQPMTSDNSMDGVNTRLIELNAIPIPDKELAQELHRVCEKHYGFAGEKYIRWLVQNLDRLHNDYERIYSELKSDDDKLNNVAVLGLADFYSSIAVFGLPEEQAFSESIDLCQAILKNLDDNAPKNSTIAAWDFVAGWVASNKARFSGSGEFRDMTPLYGVIENEKVYVIARELSKALDDAGFSSRKFIKGFQERGFIDTFVEADGKLRSQTVKRIKGVITRVYALNLATDENKATESENFDDFLN